MAALKVKNSSWGKYSSQNATEIIFFTNIQVYESFGLLRGSFKAVN